MEALINAMPLKEATLVVDRLLPSICRELESSDRRIDEYAIKVAFAKSIMGSLRLKHSRGFYLYHQLGGSIWG